MSIDGVSNSAPRYDTSDSTVAEEKPIQHVAETIATLPLRAPTLPIGAFGPHVTLGTVIADVGEVKHQVERIQADLKSDKIRALASKDEALYVAYVKANVTAASLFATGYMFKERGLQVTALLAVVSKFVDLSKTLQPFYDLATADKSARNAAADAHADIQKLGHDLLAAGESVLRLAADAVRLGP
ncbi:MAG TPA: hypothetical protein VGH28_09295 [Polyangiaceae bacterium]